MRDLNMCVFKGNICTDFIEKEFTNKTSGVPFHYIDFNIANNVGKNNSGENLVNFINFRAYNNCADNIKKYFKKGNSVVVTGFFKQDRFVDKDGNKKQRSFFIVGSIQHAGYTKKELEEYASLKESGENSELVNNLNESMNELEQMGELSLFGEESDNFIEG